MLMFVSGVSADSSSEVKPSKDAKPPLPKVHTTPKKPAGTAAAAAPGPIKPADKAKVEKAKSARASPRATPRATPLQSPGVEQPPTAVQEQPKPGREDPEKLQVSSTLSSLL